MKIEAIIFDMDGVLIEAKEWHYHALNRSLELFGYTISRAEHLSTFDGLPTSKKLEMLSIEKNLPRGLHKFLNEMKQQYTVEQVHMNCKPIFVHEYTLSKLQAAGYKLGLASNSIKSTVNLMMVKSNLANYLDVMLSNQDVSKPKPDPDMYLKAASKLGVSPEACLVLEDNINGIRAAEAAGCNVLVVQNVLEVTFDRIEDAIERVERRAE